jgi:Signal transduction histidine kinase
MKRILYIVLFLTVACMCRAQQYEYKVDSLINVLKTQKLSVDEKFSIYSDVCYYYLSNDTQKAMVYAQEALSFAEKEKDKSMIAGFYTYIGTIHRYEGDYDKAFDYYDKALDYAIEGQVDHRIAFVYGSIASLYHSQGKIVTALDYLLKALSIYEKGETEKHKQQQLTMLANIGTLHRELENIDSAILFFEKAEKLAKELNYNDGIMQVYYNLGDVFMQKKEYEKAFDYALKSLELSRSLGDKRYECGNLGLLAIISKSGVKDLVKAEKYADEYLDIATQMNFPQLLKGAWHTLATVYFEQERYAESEKASMTAWEIDSIGTDLAFHINYNRGMANMYLGDKEKATYYLEKSVEISRESANKSFQNLFLDLGAKYETEKKELRIVALEKEKKLQYLIIFLGVFILLIVTILFFLNRKITKQKIKQLEQEKQIIASQAIIEGETEERKRLARDLHDGLGGMLSVVKINLDNIEHLQNARDLLGKSIDELRRLSHNLMPSALQYGLPVALEEFCSAIPNANFHFYGTETQIDEKIKLLFYRCTYELVNNAVKHANAENINIQFVQETNRIALTVTDDGCGFDTNLKTLGMGLQNIKDRVTAFNGTIEIVSAPEKGTEVFIVLNI